MVRKVLFLDGVMCILNVNPCREHHFRWLRVAGTRQRAQLRGVVPQFSGFMDVEYEAGNKNSHGTIRPLFMLRALRE